MYRPRKHKVQEKETNRLYECSRSTPIGLRSTPTNQTRTVYFQAKDPNISPSSTSSSNTGPGVNTSAPNAAPPANRPRDEDARRPPRFSWRPASASAEEEWFHPEALLALPPFMRMYPLVYEFGLETPVVRSSYSLRAASYSSFSRSA